MSSIQNPSTNRAAIQNRSPVLNNSIYSKKKNSKFRLFDTVRSSFTGLPTKNSMGIGFGNQTCNNLSTTDMTSLSPYPNSKNTMTSIVNSSAHPVVINEAMKRKGM